MTRYGIRATLGGAVLALLVAACSASSGPGGPAPSAPASGAVIVAQGVAFDRTHVDVPADVTFPLLFENRDGVPHNVTILDAEGKPLFVGETFAGYGSRTYVVPALRAGAYRYRCDVHTDMTGTVSAGSALSRLWIMERPAAS